MEIISGKEEYYFPGRSCVMLGKFDGIHIGHRRIVDELKKQAASCEAGFVSCVCFTFDPSPANFFSGRVVAELMTRDEKRRAFEELGIDYLWEFPLNERTAATRPVDFIENILHKMLHASVIVAGEDVSFGDKGMGNGELLKEYAERFGYRVVLIPKLCLEGAEVSSSRVRAEVSRGNMEMAAALLGKPYEISGVVSKGNQRGREFGFPTLNIYPPEDKLLPPYGVYFADVHTRLGVYHSITDIGIKPTVTKEGRKVVEACLYDFDDDLYDTDITVSLLYYRRPEMKFSSVDKLIETIGNDKAAGEIFFSK